MEGTNGFDPSVSTSAAQEGKRYSREAQDGIMRLEGDSAACRRPGSA